MKNTPTTFAYLRVSTNDQNLAKNKKDILLLAHSKNLSRVQFVEEIVSGKVNWRERKLGSIISDAKDGDSLIVSELSRLGRSMLECMEILSLASQKGLQIFAVKGNWHLDGTIQSKIIAMAFSMAAEIERDLISQRTTEALQAKKAAGIKLGRPKGPGRSKLDRYRPEIEALLNNGATQAFIAERYQTSRVNMHKWLSKHKLNRRVM
jgi:DNA invertase Pin-like site-specific DNA recombinase